MSNNITSDCIKVARERVNWAWEHIENFKREADNFLTLAPYDSVSDIHMEGQEYVASFHIKVKQMPPSRLRFIAGDAIHNLDSALDNISYALTRHKFPIFNSPASLEENTRKWLPKVSPDVSVLMRALQPYNAGNSPQMHQLRVLRTLSGSDKHEAPMLLACVIPAWGYIHWGTQSICEKRKSRCGLTDGAEIVAWASTNLKAIQDLHPHFSFAVAFENSPPGSALSWLVELHKFIRDEVIAKFEPLCLRQISHP